MEAQTIYYTGTSMGVPQGVNVSKTSGQLVQPFVSGDAPQAIYYTPGSQLLQQQQQQHQQQQQPSMVVPTSATTFYSQQPQQNFYPVQPMQNTSVAAPIGSQVYTVGASPQHQYQQQQQQPQYQGGAQNQLQSPQLFYTPSNVVSASSAQPPRSVAQFQTQYQPPQATSPTRVVQYSPQTSYQVQPTQDQPVYGGSPQQISMSPRQIPQTMVQPTVYQPQQTVYQPVQAPTSATQQQVINLNQHPQQRQMQMQPQVQPQQRQYAQQAGAHIDWGASPMAPEANQQAANSQPMGKDAPGANTTPTQQPQSQQRYQPPEQRSLQQSVVTQQRRPATHSTPQRRVASPSEAAPKLRQLQPRRSMDRGDMEGPPEFLQQSEPQVTVNEGDCLTLKAVVRPAGDPTLKVQWFKNGAPTTASSRHVEVMDRGYVEYQFLYTNITDSGEYFCEARTANGTTRSKNYMVMIVPEDNVVTESQLPEESMIMNLAAMETQLSLNSTSRREEEAKFTSAPQFLRPLLSQLGLKENERAKFETFVQPANDPSLTIEWYKNEEPIKSGCRFTETLDRGYVILDILYTYPEDSGRYHCVAKNSAGTASSNVVELSCKGGTGIVTDSVLSAESVHYLQSLDSNEVSNSQDQRYLETDQQQPAPPSFELKPMDAAVIEGSPVRLLVKAGGFPHPRIQWFINGDVLPASGGGGAWRIYNDGGISYLEFNRCGPPGEYTVTSVAKNNLGESVAECSLVIDPQPDYRPDLKHIAPDNPFRRMASLKKVERSEELKNAFQKSKPPVLELRKLERRSSQTEGPNDTELLYAQVQGSLRSNRRSMQLDSRPVSTPGTQPPPPSRHRQPDPPQPMQQTAIQPPATQRQAPTPTASMPPMHQKADPAAHKYEMGGVSNVQPDTQYSCTSTSAEFNIQL